VCTWLEDWSVYSISVIRASIPRLNLDDAFEQKNEIAKAVEAELEKVMFKYSFGRISGIPRLLFERAECL
jgi:hypothetical protein